VRSVVAKRMAESARTVAPVTLTTEADATELVRLRARTKDDYAEDEAPPAPVPTVTDLMVRIVALALADHPEMNASLTDDGIVRHAAAHVGIAVDTGRGLLVPVIRDAGRKSAGQIAAESAGLIERARTGTATPDELRGGTFTVTNLGMYEIDAFTPIVNLPECAILGVGRVVARPVVVDEATDEVAVRKMMALSLTFDHRVVDGAPAARFLRDVKRLVEHPFRWLMR
jgi:pyruvate dehydrogenase E2 component (dihydrolipoamide acetyltransferase)